MNLKIRIVGVAVAALWAFAGLASASTITQFVSDQETFSNPAFWEYTVTINNGGNAVKPGVVQQSNVLGQLYV